MADLMRESTSYDKLCKKYSQFAAPTVRILVEGVDVIEKKRASVSDLAVDLSCEATAASASFNVLDEYDREKSAFKKDGTADMLQLGAKVEVALGYIRTEVVFCGLVVELEYVLDEEDNAPYLHVVCMDAACLLMRQQSMQLYSGKSVSDVVGELFASKPFADYVAGTQVDKTSEKLEMVPSAAESDFALVVRHARLLGYEFFVCQGKAYFRKPPAKASSILTLSAQSLLLLGARLSLRSVGLSKHIVVAGVGAADGKAVKGTAVLQGKFSKGATAARMLGDATKYVTDPTATSAKAAQDRAELLMAQAGGSFGRLRCRCAGLPELVPGRSVEMKGFLPQAEAACYILQVSHSFTDSGFYTTFEARVDQYHV